MQSEEIDQIIPALIAAKAQFSPVLKDRANDFFKSRYATLQSVLDAVEPALAEQQLVLVQPTRVGTDGKNIQQTYLYHESGQYLLAEYAITPAANVPVTPQTEGSAQTYSKRYGAMALLCLAPEDDDGNASSRAPVAPPRDWLKELASATTVGQAKQIGRDAAAVGQWEPIKEIGFARVAELEAEGEPSAESVAAQLGATAV